MCGIFGGPQFTVYERLYNENKKRGSFAYGSLYTTCNGREGLREIYIRKRPGIISLTGDYAFSGEYNMYLGHTQAPTSNQRTFSPITSHPFDASHYIVAHNGIIENYKQLVAEYIPDHLNPVDSSIIPALIGVMYEYGCDEATDGNKTPEVLAIERACSLLKGTFGCWIYSKLTGCTYLARCGSTLYGNILKGMFSSIRVPEMCEKALGEGMIYCVTGEGLTECGQFQVNSPVFL